MAPGASQFPPFVPSQDQWTIYAERMDQYFLANKIKESTAAGVDNTEVQELKRATLLTVVGTDTYILLRNLIAPSRLTDKSYDELKAVLAKHYDPAPLEIVERVKFYRRDRIIGESVSSFVAAIRKMTEFCNFGTTLDTMLRDKFIAGINNDPVQRELLNIPQVTFEKAVTKALSIETIERESKSINSNSRNDPDTAINKIASNKYRNNPPRTGASTPFQSRHKDYTPKDPQSSKPTYQQKHEQHQSWNKACTRCTSSRHNESECPFMTAECYSFHKKGHIASACRKYPRQQVRREQPYRPRHETHQTHYITPHPALIYKGHGPTLMGRQWIFSAFNIIPRSENHVYHMEHPPSGIEQILIKHKNLFSPGIGCLKGVKVKLHIKSDAHPRFYKARSLPYHLKDKVEEEILRLRDNGIISSIPYAESATPIVPILKQNKEIRICGDFKVTTNKIIDTEKYPLPKVEDIFAKLAGCTVFSRLDLRNAYNQLELAEDSRKHVVINTTKGLFQYNRLPFGISSASAIFQRHMETLLQDHPSCLPFQDDNIVGGRNIEDHNQKLDRILTTLEDAGLKLNREKCQFLRPSVDFLGYRLDAHGLHPQEGKLEAIKKAPAPKSVEELRSFLGLINYYSRFIPQSSTLLAPLYTLLNKSSKFEWTSKHQDTFNIAKEAIQSSDMLVHFDPDREIILACDASPVGLGAVISHIIDNEERPIAFASRSLAKAERQYPQIEREALAIIFGIVRFRDYLLGKKFTLVTDHKPLVVIFSEDKQVPPMAAARIQRWALMLSEYDYKIIHKKGSAHSNADALSRLPIQQQEREPPLPTELVLLLRSGDDSPINTQEMSRATEQDVTLSKVMVFTRRGWPTNLSSVPNETARYHRRRYEISIAKDILLIGNKVIVPSSMRPKIMAELHSTHQGVRSMKELARAKVWWPGIDEDLDNWSQNCKTCRVLAPMPPKTYSPWPPENQPWRRVHIDFAGPVERQFLLITIDSFSKWMEVDITKNTTSATVINCLRQHIARFGIMTKLVSDNGTCFTSEEFRNFAVMNGIEHITTAPYHPESNGQAERSVRTVKTTLRKITGETSVETELIGDGLTKYQEGSLQLRLTRFLLNYRRTPVNGGSSPAEKMLNRTLRTRMDLFHPDQRNDHTNKQEKNGKKTTE